MFGALRLGRGGVRGVARAALAARPCGAAAGDAPAAAGRALHATPPAAAKVLCVLYPDPTGGYPPPPVRDGIPTITHYPDGSTVPSPAAVDFTPGALLGSVSGELGLRHFLEAGGHSLVVTSDKGPDSAFDAHLPDADFVISQPFFPAYLTAERLAAAPRLRAAITAGIGSDHVDLAAAIDRGVNVCEVSYCNSVSVAEHATMMALSLVRNYLPSHAVAAGGGWNIADCVARAYDIEGMAVGTVAAGRIGLGILRRLHPFGCALHYTDRHRLPADVEAQYGLTYWASWTEMAAAMDVVTLNCPLHPETEHMVNADTIGAFKRGAYLINTARGKLCDADVIAAALADGRLAGYAGDVWYPQPPPADHPWRTAPWSGMTPHTSGTTLSAQARYAAGVREILECYLASPPKPIRPEYQIVTDGKLAGAGAHAYSV
ncbi:hypothetical protein BU14_0082s0076 [Porphyra umbilicalis]|uniref:Formate dehydrogenase n=1 Tax=Porphyra umbilicalis TaxID=2786 RepID=A0A1X6PEN4_PORUM|nr:hypothetical protein BU14_0082s0076 [Porphyra umbilicalis]|eukprot:OSX79312.1 hypothetical protein BU14_0082s0076 [Porphyra umbilicalis]